MSAHSLTAKPLVGCAGWSLPAAAQKFFPEAPSHLARYACVLPAVEINSSFYRPHRHNTYARWRDSVPDGFQFSVKVPKTLTHEQRLQDREALLDQFASEVRNLGEKLGCLLVQLPPSLEFEAAAARRFFDRLQTLTETPVVCEPRHASWFEEKAATLLARARVSYVFADPHPVAVPVPDIGAGVVYLRLHGSPLIYRSPYQAAALAAFEAQLRAALSAGKKAWCIFDNTAAGAAVHDALTLWSRFGGDEPQLQAAKPANLR